MVAERLGRSRKLLIASGVCLVLGLLVGGPVTFGYVARAFPAVTHSVAELDAGESKIVTGLDPDVRVLLCLVVDSLDEPVPPLDVTVRGTDGDEVGTEPASGWARMVGRNFRRVLAIRPPAEGSIELRVDVVDGGAGEDFTLLRHPDDVAAKEVKRALPGWIVAGLLLAGSVILFFAAAIGQGREAGALGEP